MNIYFSDHIDLPLPEGHRFPIDKYPRLRKRVENAGFVPAANLCTPDAASIEQLLLVHEEGYIQKVVQGKLSERETRRIGFPWSPGLVQRSLRSVGCTIASCRAALLDGIAINLAGGTHHAYADHGEGFCVFNDCAVAARTMQSEGRANRVLILDCDVHQGNGTAAIFAGDPNVFTFSIHGQKNFPFHKEPSSLDIALPDGSGDQAYLQALETGLEQAISLGQADLAIYLAGADPFYDDRLGRLGLTKSGLAERDRLVFKRCHQAGLPVAITMSGGYARNVDDTVDIHFQTVKQAVESALHKPG